MEKVVLWGFFSPIQILLKMRSFSKTFPGFPSQFTFYLINVTIVSPLKWYFLIKFFMIRQEIIAIDTPYGYLLHSYFQSFLNQEK